SLTMNLAGVEQSDAVVAFVAQDERELSPGEQHAFDVDLCFRSIDDCEKAGARFGQKNTRDELREIFFVDVILVFGVRNNEFDSCATKNLLIKVALHRVTGSEERESFEISRFHVIATRFDNANERNGRSRSNFVEDNVRRVRGNDSKFGAGARKLLDLG